MTGHADASRPDGMRPDGSWFDRVWADLAPADPADWAGRAWAWLSEGDNPLILAGALAGAVVLLWAVQELRGFRRARRRADALAGRLALAGCETIALRVRLARRDGPPDPAVGAPDGVGPGRVGPGRIGPGRIGQERIGIAGGPDRAAWEADRGDDAAAAKLVMAAGSFAEACAVFVLHRAAPRGTDGERALWALLWRLEMEDGGVAVGELAGAFGATEEICIEAEAADVLERLYFRGATGSDGVGRIAGGGR